MHRFVERQAERTPDAEAFRWRGGRVRYRELDERANRLARLLRRHGVGGGDRVGVCLRRGPELVVAVLAVLKAGACLVAMDPAHPARRAEFAAADSGARLLLTERAVRDRLWPGGAPVGAPGRVVCREELDPAGVPATRPPVRVGPGDLAYLTYTSGATGTPKGVLVEHRSVAALLSWVGEAFTARELDGVLAATSVCSDLSVFEIFGPLAHGGRFVLADTAPDPVAPGAVEGVRLLSTVPSTMRELLAADAVPPGVETVCLAGEPLTEDLARRVWRLPGLRRLLNLYGSAEGTACSTWAEVGRDHRGTPPIGVPLPGTRAYVLDDASAEAPPGAVGELHLAGDGLARGYLGRPEEERARFLPDPFAAR
ncbi:AMP-binding protein, partial [Actinosynnema sp. NPDC059797]